MFVRITRPHLLMFKQLITREWPLNSRNKIDATQGVKKICIISTYSHHLVSSHTARKAAKRGRHGDRERWRESAGVINSEFIFRVNRIQLVPLLLLLVADWPVDLTMRDGKSSKETSEATFGHLRLPSALARKIVTAMCTNSPCLLI